MRSSREILAIQKMESLPVPRTSTILPPPLKLSDAWDTLAALRADEADDFGSSDPSEWNTDSVDTIPVPPPNE